MAVRAPFNFARIPRKVWYPDWGELVTHDVPFADGWSGHIELEIEAKTELLVGGPRRKATDERGGEVWPVHLPDGSYAIPPSALQGMIRAILEISCFGKLGPWIDDRRFAVRDISTNATGRQIYGARMTVPGRTGTFDSPFEPRTKTGWLIKCDGGCEIIPCEMSRINVGNIVSLATLTKQAELNQKLTSSSDAKARIKTWNDYGPGSDQIRIDLEPAQAHRHSRGQYIHYSRATAGGTTEATLVLTGKPQPGLGNGSKKWDFAFYRPHRNDASDSTKPRIPVPPDVQRDFLLIHSPPKGSGQKENPNWTVHKVAFEGGDPIPIFYLETVGADKKPLKETVAAMGTAFMFKLAQTNSTHQMLKNSSADHVSPMSDLDLPSLIFGTVEGEEGKPGFKQSLKRRASFEWAVAQLPQNACGPIASNATILSSPKPSYYPIYVRQPNRDGNQLQLRRKQHPQGLDRDVADQSYASYTPLSADNPVELYSPELAGTKLWPAAPDRLQSPHLNLPQPPQAVQGNNKVQIRLNALPVGAKFAVKLHIHNLRAAEVGALLWALTFGDEDALHGKPGKYRHRLGMGKPFGLGSLSLVVRNTDGLRPNAPDSPSNFLVQFLEEANSFVGRNRDWSTCSAVRALYKTADPSASEQTTYMNLDFPHDRFQRKNRDGVWQEAAAAGQDSYVGAREMGHFLPPFLAIADGWEFEKPGQSSSQQDGQRAQQQQSGSGFRSPQNARHKVHDRRHAASIPPESGCRVRRIADGLAGTLGTSNYGAWNVTWGDGTASLAPLNSFTVIAPPSGE